MTPLERHAANEYAKTRAKVDKACRKIELEIENNEGVYPANKGRVTVAELCRIAGLSQAVLQGPAHRTTTRVEVNGWAARVKARMVAGHRRVRRAVTDRADEWQRAYQELQRGWALAELEYNEEKARAAELEKRLAKVQKDLAKAQEELTVLKAAPGKVVWMKDRAPR